MALWGVDWNGETKLLNKDIFFGGDIPYMEKRALLTKAD
jgi:hypothetical protein